MSIEQHIRALFEDIESCSRAGQQDMHAFLKKFPFIPPMIGAGDGRMIFLSESGLHETLKIAEIIRNNSPALAAALSERDMAEVTQKAIAQLLFGPTDKTIMDFQVPSDLKQFKKVLRIIIESIVNGLHQPRSHIFGVWLFDDKTAVPPFSIGPISGTSMASYAGPLCGLAKLAMSPSILLRS